MIKSPFKFTNSLFHFQVICLFPVPGDDVICLVNYKDIDGNVAL